MKPLKPIRMTYWMCPFPACVAQSEDLAAIEAHMKVRHAKD